MNNDREELEARIAAYIDGDLPPADAARLEVFLANSDPKLAEQVIGMIGDKHRLRSLPKARAPDDLAPRILEQIERTTLLNNVDQFAAHQRPWWQSKAVMAAALFLVFGGFTYFILQALHTANPAWQAAVEPNAQHPPLVAENTPEAPAPAPSPAPPAPLATAQKSAARMTPATHDAPMMAATPSLPPLPPASTSPSPDASALAASQVSVPPVKLVLIAQTADDFTRLQRMIENFRPAGSPQDAGPAAPQAAGDTAPSAKNPAAMPANEGNLPSNANTDNSEATADQQQRQDSFNNHQNNPTALPAPVTYRLSLRPAQIAQLTREFHVENPTPSTPNNVQPDIAGAGNAEPAGHAATAPATDMTNQNATTASNAALDCIITMTPAPPATAPANP